MLLCSGLPRGHIQVWPAKDSKVLLIFKIVKQFSVNANPSIVENYQRFLSAWTELLAKPCSSDEASALPSLVDCTLQGLVKITCMLDKETFVLATQEHIQCTNTCNVQCVIQKLLLELEASDIFKAVCEKVVQLSEGDLRKLKNIFGVWPSVGTQVTVEAQLLALKRRPCEKNPCCDMNQSLCLCHFFTAFLLSWPYSLPPIPGTLGAALQDLSHKAQSGAYGQLLMDELSTLHRQLRKLTGYHSPTNRSPEPNPEQDCG